MAAANHPAPSAVTANTSIANTANVNILTGPSGFLALSREIRNTVYCFAFEGATCDIVIAGEGCKTSISINFPLALAYTCHAVHEETSEHLRKHLQASLLVQDHYTSSYSLAALIPAILLDCVHEYSFSYPDCTRVIFRVWLHQKFSDVKLLQNLKRMKMDAGPFYTRTTIYGGPSEYRVSVCKLGRLLNRTFASFIAAMITKLASECVQTTVAAKLCAPSRTLRPGEKHPVRLYAKAELTHILCHGHPGNDGPSLETQFRTSDYKSLPADECFDDIVAERVHLPRTTNGTPLDEMLGIRLGELKEVSMKRRDLDNLLVPLPL